MEGQLIVTGRLPLRLWLALAMLPFANALAAYVGFPVIWYIGGHAGRPYDPAQTARAVAALAFVMAVLVTICGALPIVWSMWRRGRLSLAQLLRAGVLLGNAPFAVYVLGLLLPMTVIHIIEGDMSERWLPVSELIAATLRIVAIGSAHGAWSAIVLWCVGVAGADADPR